MSKKKLADNSFYSIFFVFVFVFEWVNLYTSLSLSLSKGSSHTMMYHSFFFSLLFFKK